MGRSGPLGYARYRQSSRKDVLPPCIGDWGKDFLIITGLQLFSQTSCRDHKFICQIFYSNCFLLLAEYAKEQQYHAPLYLLTAISRDNEQI